MSEARNYKPEPAGDSGEILPEDVVRRLWRAADRQIAESERRMTGLSEAEVEREARTLSVIGKLVRDLAEISAQARRDSQSETVEQQRYGDAVDVDRFRADLANRVERLREERAATPLAGTVLAS
jgi:hypothetical protein